MHIADVNIQMRWQTNALTTWNPLPAGQQAYRFSGTNSPAKLPFGLARNGDIPADLVTWGNTEGYNYGNETDLLFYDDANITVDLVVNLHAVKKEPVYFFLTDGGTEIPGTRVSYTPKLDNGKQTIIPRMSTKVRNGEQIGLSWETTSASGAYLETDDKRYPMLLAKITTQGAV